MLSAKWHETITTKARGSSAPGDFIFKQTEMEIDMKTEFAGIKRKDNWGSTYYEFDNSPSGQRARFVDGQKLNVMFPDGTIRSARIKIESSNKSMMDMGHTYNYRDDVVYVIIELFGVDVKVDVEKLKFEVGRADVEAILQ